MPGRWAAVVLAVAVGVGPAAGQDPTAERIRDKVRRAVGYDAFRKLTDGVELSGKCEYWGIPGTFRLRLHPDGRYVRTWTAEGDHALGFDGKTRWGRNFSEPPFPLGLDEADRDRFLFGVLAHRWLAADGGFAVALDPEEHRAYRPCLLLSHPDAGVTARLAIDGTTWRPQTLSIPGRPGRLVEFDDDREVAGAWVAGRASVDRYQGGQWYAADRAGAAGPADADPFASPAAKPDAVFDPAAPAELEVRRAGEKLLLVRPTIDGKPAGWFLLDSGSGITTITAAAADRLGLPAFGRFPLHGTGGEAASRFRRTARLALGKATVPVGVTAELPAAFVDGLNQAAGCEVVGTVGWGVLNRVVVEVDRREGVVAIHDPTTYRLPAGANWHPVSFNNRTPCLRGTFEGRHAGLFQFDTGQEAPLSFQPAAVRRLNLLDGRATEPVQEVGIAGTDDARDGQGAEFQVLGRTARPIRTVFKTSGAADPHTLGSFGLAALGPGAVVFDYPNRRVAFVPKP